MPESRIAEALSTGVAKKRLVGLLLFREEVLFRSLVVDDIPEDRVALILRKDKLHVDFVHHEPDVGFIDALEFVLAAVVVRAVEGALFTDHENAAGGYVLDAPLAKHFLRRLVALAIVPPSLKDDDRLYTH